MLNITGIIRHVPPDASQLAQRIENSRHVILIEVNADDSVRTLTVQERDLIARALLGEA